MLNKLILFILISIILIHSFILTKLIYFPYPELFIYPYLTNIGLKPYSQILDQHFPGLLFLPINFNNLGMLTPEIARIWSVVLVMVNQILLYYVGKKLLGSPARALVVNFLYLIWQPFFEGWVLWIDSFLALFLLPAYYAIFRRRFLLAGLFIGVSIVFKQVLIPLAVLIGIYILWRERNFRKVTYYILGLFIPIALMLVYFLGIGVLKDFWYWTVVFNLTTYAQFGRGFSPTTAHLTRVLFVFGLPAMLLLSDKFKKQQSPLLLIFLSGTLLGLSTRFDFVHFQPALPFAVLATVYGLGRLRGLGIIAYGAVTIWWLVIFYRGHLGDRIISFESGTRSLANLIQYYTKPKEKIFVFGTAPHLYQMTNTRPAGDIYVFQFPWFLKVSEGRILEGIIKDKPRIIVSDRQAIIEGKKISDFAPDIDQYISQNYREIDGIGSIKILHRKPY